jgi:hypothetical protein
VIVEEDGLVVVDICEIVVVVGVKQERLVSVRDLRCDQRPQMRSSLTAGREIVPALKVLKVTSRFWSQKFMN